MGSWLQKAYWNVFTVWHARGEERLPYRPIEEIVSIQNRRVKSIVCHAYETVPFYREAMDRAALRPADFRTAADLAQLPTVTGDQLAAAPEMFISTGYAAGRAFRVQTSGTTGRLKEIHYDTPALFLAMAHGHRQRAVIASFIGRRFGYREMLLYPSISLNFRLRDFYESRCWIPAGMDHRRASISITRSIEENLAVINAFKPELLRGVGSHVGALFRGIWERKLSVFLPKLVMYGGDQLSDEDRLLIETEFGVPVLSTYQSAEALRIAFQCEQRNGFHVNLDRYAVRVVNSQGEDVPGGQRGAILLSNLTSRATVLLNYRLGDTVTVGQGRCPCGRNLPTIERIEGRVSDFLILPGGKIYDCHDLLRKLQSVTGVVQLRLIQEDVRRFSVLVVSARESDWEQISAGLAAVMRLTLGKEIEVKSERVDSIPQHVSGKMKVVVSQVQSTRR
jgi:phenylacetate-CoA ligase